MREPDNPTTPKSQPGTAGPDELLARIPAHEASSPAAAARPGVGAVQTGWAGWLVPSMTDVFFMALVVWLFCAGPLGWVALLTDGDAGWHIRTGERVLATGVVPSTDPFSFSKPGAEWFAWEWGADVIYAALHTAFGLKGVVLFAGLLIAFSTTVLLSHMIWRGANFLVALPLAVLTVGVSSIHYLARPHVFTLALLPVCLWMVDRDRRQHTRWLWTIPLIQVAWTNLHGGFMAWIAFTGLLMAGEAFACVPDWLAGKRSPVGEARAQRYGLLLVLCAAATFVNPFGYRLHQHIGKYLQSDFIHEAVSEFQSPQFRSESMLQFEILLLAAMVAAGVALFSRSRDWVALLWVLFWAHQSLHAVRHATIFVLAAAPLIAAVASEWFARLAVTQKKSSVTGILYALGVDTAAKFRRVSLWPVAFVAGLALLGNPPVHWPTDFPAEKFPLRLMHKHRELFVKHRTLTSDQWGDYLIYQSDPAQKVFIDGRSDFYGAQLGREYMRLFAGDWGWEKTLAKHGFEVVLAPDEWPLTRLLAQDPAWRMVEYDRRKKTSAATLFVKKNSPADRAEHDRAEHDRAEHGRAEQ